MQVDFFIVAQKCLSWSKIDSSARVDFFRAMLLLAITETFWICFVRFKFEISFILYIRIHSNSVEIITTVTQSMNFHKGFFFWEWNEHKNKRRHSFNFCGFTFIVPRLRNLFCFNFFFLPLSFAICVCLRLCIIQKNNLKMKQSTKLLLHFIMMNKMERTFFYWNEKPYQPNTIDWTVEQLNITRWDSLNSKNTISCSLLEKEKFRLLFFVLFHSFIPFDRFGCLHYSFDRVVCKLVCVCKGSVRFWEISKGIMFYYSCHIGIVCTIHLTGNSLNSILFIIIIVVDVLVIQRHSNRARFRLIVFPPTKNILNWAISRHLSNRTIKFFSSVPVSGTKINPQRQTTVKKYICFLLLVLQ